MTPAGVGRERNQPLAAPALPVPGCGTVPGKLCTWQQPAWLSRSRLCAGGCGTALSEDGGGDRRPQLEQPGSGSG